MRFGLRCFTCGKGFDPTDAHAEIWCDGENVVTLCADCALASDLRINMPDRPLAPEQPRLPAPQDGWQEPADQNTTFIWDALKRIQNREDQTRRKRAD
jgi:hypothetical protein